jgi:hypothetical protein
MLSKAVSASKKSTLSTINGLIFQKVKDHLASGKEHADVCDVGASEGMDMWLRPSEE